jgi:hypothetical protein
MPTEDHKYDCDLLQPAEECLDIQAIGLDSQKRLGEIAEVSFLAKASSLGFGVSKPWVEQRHDFVLDSGYRFWRVPDFVSRDCAEPSRGSSRAGNARPPFFRGVGPALYLRWDG